MNLDRLIGRITGFLHTISGFLLLSMAFVIMYGIVARETGIGSVGVEEIAVYVTVIAIWLGVAHLLREGRHIEIDAVRSRLPPRGQFILRLFSLVMTAAAAAAMVWYGSVLASNAHQIGIKTEIFEVPRYLIQIVLPLGMFLMFLEAFVRIVRLFKGKAKEEEFKGL